MPPVGRALLRGMYGQEPPSWAQSLAEKGGERNLGRAFKWRISSRDLNALCVLIQAGTGWPELLPAGWQVVRAVVVQADDFQAPPTCPQCWAGRSEPSDGLAAGFFSPSPYNVMPQLVMRNHDWLPASLVFAEGSYKLHIFKINPCVVCFSFCPSVVLSRCMRYREGPRQGLWLDRGMSSERTRASQCCPRVACPCPYSLKAPEALLGSLPGLHLPTPVVSAGLCQEPGLAALG